IPDLLLSTMPSGSTRLTVASLYSLPLTVLKSSASASDADSVARIAMIVFRGVTVSGFCPFARHTATTKCSQRASRRNALAIERRVSLRYKEASITNRMVFRWILRFVVLLVVMPCAVFYLFILPAWVASGTSALSVGTVVFAGFLYVQLWVLTAELA